jgi:hypothetical protein
MIPAGEGGWLADVDRFTLMCSTTTGLATPLLYKLTAYHVTNLVNEFFRLYVFPFTSTFRRGSRTR